MTDRVKVMQQLHKLLYIDVRNLPDYEGYDSSNKIPFFKDMWGAGAKFIDDALINLSKLKVLILILIL